MKLKLLFLLLPLSGLCQTDTGGKTITTKAQKNIFYNAANEAISPAAYMQLVNAGLYKIYFNQHGDSLIEYQLDSSKLLKSFHKEIVVPNLKNIAGRKIAFPKNQKIILNFWSTICKPCLEEIDSLSAFTQKYPSLNIIAVTSDSASLIKKFLKTRKVKYKIAFLKKEELESIYNVTAFPTLFFVDEKKYRIM